MPLSTLLTNLDSSRRELAPKYYILEAHQFRRKSLRLSRLKALYRQETWYKLELEFLEQSILYMLSAPTCFAPVKEGSIWTIYYHSQLGTFTQKLQAWTAPPSLYQLFLVERSVFTGEIAHKFCSNLWKTSREDLPRTIAATRMRAPTPENLSAWSGSLIGTQSAPKSSWKNSTKWSIRFEND